MPKSRHDPANEIGVREPLFRSHEIDIFKEIITDEFLHRHGWTRGLRGKVTVKSGRVLFWNGYLDAIEKLLSLYHEDNQEEFALSFYEFEIDALKKAISDVFMRYEGWARGPRGGVTDHNGRVIFRDGYVDAIERFLNRYDEVNSVDSEDELVEDLVYQEYKSAVISAELLTETDKEQLKILAAGFSNGRVMVWDTKIIIKLNQPDPDELTACKTSEELSAAFFSYPEALSKKLKAIIVVAGKEGFRLLEFDSNVACRNNY